MNKRCSTLLAILALCASPFCQAELPSFQQFAAMPERTLIADEWVAAAASGDPVGQLMVVVSLRASGKESLAMDLLEAMWGHVGYRPDRVGPRPRPLRDGDGAEYELAPANLMYSYEELAQYRLATQTDAAMLERGLRILKANSDHGHAFSTSTLAVALHKHPMLPDASSLVLRWFELAEEGKTFTIDDLAPESEDDADEMPLPPAADEFGTCPAPLDRLESLLAEAEATEAAIREQPAAAEALLAAMIERIETLSGDGRAPSITLLFPSLPLRVVVSIVLDMLQPPNADFVLLDAPWLESQWISVYWRNLPAPLLLAQLNREFGGAGFRCAKGWVRWDPGTTEPPSEPFLLLPTPILAGNPAAEGSQTVRWPGPIDYEGELVDGRPDGRGVLRIGDTQVHARRVHSGQFRRGLLYGEGEIRDGSGTLIASGRFSRGLLNGPGRLVSDTGSTLEGTFADGVLVSGTGRQALATIKQGAPRLDYSGPFENDLPHGLGQCRGEGFSYPCRFHRGLFVGVGDVLLIPGASEPDAAKAAAASGR